MKRVNRLINHPVYQDKLKRIEEAERERDFCRHGLGHALDVARIMYITVLEKNLCFDKELVYGTAILHDIGRDEQYASNIPHHQAGAEAALEILPDCGYSKEEILLITEAIRTHRGRRQTQGAMADVSLNDLLYQADKLSRNCFDCPAKKECYWQEEMRNKAIEY